jgi:hypothetical protein
MADVAASVEIAAITYFPESSIVDAAYGVFCFASTLT